VRRNGANVACQGTEVQQEDQQAILAAVQPRRNAVVTFEKSF